MGPLRFVLTAAVVLGYLAALDSEPAAAAELQRHTSQAYDAYLVQAKRAFLQRIRNQAAVPRRDGVVPAAPGREDGIVDVPDGLVHHWIGTAFIRDVTLRQVVDMSRAHSTYSSIYKAIIASKLLGRQGDTFSVLMRLKEGEAGVSAVLDVRSTIQYINETSRGVYAISDAHEIREVKNPGGRDEYLLPAGRDSGYLWRANTFTYFLEMNDGVYVETETLGLSRRFPPLFGWIIEPIARRLGRRSVETSLREFLAAVQRSTRAPR